MSESPAAKPERRNWLALLPLILFLGLAAIFLAQLMSAATAQTLPSALIGAPVPVTSLPPIEALAPIPGIAPEDFKGRVTVLNVFASWCAPCRDEHPALMELAKDTRFQLIGMNYKDKPENAAAFLAELGNPFAKIGSDVSGRAGIDWGVYGVPETNVIGPDGMGVNYGLNKVRFTSPVPVGSRLRARMRLLACDPIDNQGMQMTWEVAVEREGVTKPVCIAESIARHYP